MLEYRIPHIDASKLTMMTGRKNMSRYELVPPVAVLRSLHANCYTKERISNCHILALQIIFTAN